MSKELFELDVQGLLIRLNQSTNDLVDLTEDSNKQIRELLDIIKAYFKEVGVL